MPRVRIDASFCMLAVLGIFLVPLNWLLAAYLAAAIHEAGHLSVLSLTRCRVRFVRIGAFGAIIGTEPMSWRQEFLCTLAGPVFSLLLAVPVPIWPELALCGMIQGFFNLIPVYPLDGGRCLGGFLRHVFPARAVCLQRLSETLACMGLILAGFLQGGSIRIFLWAGVGMALFRKISCKESLQALQ